MILENSSDIILEMKEIRLLDDQPATVLVLRNAACLVITTSAMALYKSFEAISDPLGNGLQAMCEIPVSDDLLHCDGGFVKEYRAGYVGLQDGKVVLITPNDIQLFPSKETALRNQQELARLKLAK